MDEDKTELTPAVEPEEPKPAPRNMATIYLLRLLVSGYVCYLGASLLGPIFSGEETRLGMILSAAVLILGGGGFAVYTLWRMAKKK